MIDTRCDYCQLRNNVAVWRQTGELVCYDCRLDMLNVEFEDARPVSITGLDDTIIVGDEDYQVAVNLRTADHETTEVLH